MLSQEMPTRIVGANIVKGAVFQIGGTLYLADSDTAISGAPSEYMKMTPSSDGSVCTAAFVSSLTGVAWNSTYNGWYDTGSPASFYDFDEGKAFTAGKISSLKRGRDLSLPLGSGWLTTLKQNLDASWTTALSKALGTGWVDLIGSALGAGWSGAIKNSFGNRLLHCDFNYDTISKIFLLLSSNGLPAGNYLVSGQLVVNGGSGAGMSIDYNGAGGGTLRLQNGATGYDIPSSDTWASYRGRLAVIVI
jgi:hypothetical protein